MHFWPAEAIQKQRSIGADIYQVLPKYRANMFEIIIVQYPKAEHRPSAAICSAELEARWHEGGSVAPAREHSVHPSSQRAQKVEFHSAAGTARGGSMVSTGSLIIGGWSIEPGVPSELPDCALDFVGPTKRIDARARTPSQDKAF
jgi:hypothetical protein